jgi:acyl-CoA synthetase (AMP-forming)/AMP-acid ligase II
MFASTDHCYRVLGQADKLAAGLLGLGLKPGDRLGICGPNSSHWYITFIAAARAGFVLVSEPQKMCGSTESNIWAVEY